ncbi:MAG: NAD(P)-dependent oxidoreductase, partial [Actinomycetota bacterium]|nr:NAD(P)-dependent oxidoreductase [Actinomycetota bacterium]
MAVLDTAYPVNLLVAGRSCLVVGGGTVAARKVEGLMACDARVHVVSPLVDDEIRGWP